MSTKTVCPNCGWRSKPTTPARANYSLRQHSCDLHRRRQDIAARAAAKLADPGVPKPCLHKRVQHEHGTHTTYVLDECRCRPCRDGHAAYTAHMARMKAYGRWRPYVDAEPARLHVKALLAYGIGLKRIAALSGVSNGALGKLIYGEDHPPSRQIRPTNEARILAIRPSLDLLGATVNVDATGTSRRLQALVAVGWSVSKLARRLGVQHSNLWKTMRSPRVYAATARQVHNLYDELWDTPPPEATHRDKIAASRSRRYARDRGWPPPMAWDDDAIDDPAAAPTLGEQVSRVEALAENSDELLAQGHTLDQAAERLGITKSGLLRARSRARQQGRAA